MAERRYTLATFFEESYKEAWRLFREGDRDTSEAVRLYTEISSRHDLTFKARSVVDAYLNVAKGLLDVARREHAAHFCANARGRNWTLGEVYQIQVDERDRRRAARGVRSPGQAIPNSQDVPGVTDNSQRTEPHYTKSLNAIIEMDFSQYTNSLDAIVEVDSDNNNPLPDIVRSNSGTDRKKGGNEP
ncbi:hypothetical protein FPOAC1_010483 [Fusarium poae]|uniref:hypothetical protein n=1 Tax=Fusarium poae TaxID=36050 RepID=UPI001CEAD221|nr:hypothetical protein FPOAC1_010483 [Fusarium poae]KAG8665684.1 hypothetical protein FPOAC1_010483 [Fusarium poae]